MASYIGRDNKTIYILDKQLKNGGEGVVYSIVGKPNLVAKIYKAERVADTTMREATRDKILAMLDMRFTPTMNGRVFVAWPEDALFDEHGVFHGFVMPKISNMKSLIWATRPSDRIALWPKGYRWHYSIAIAFNLSLIIEKLHESGIIIGDMNTNNILVDSSGNVTLIDADSFNITTKDGKLYKCVVGFPEVLPAELQGKDLTKPTSQFTEKTDCFSLAVHIFSLLCNNCHPFGCLNYNTEHGSTSKPKIMDNIVKGYCPYVNDIPNETVVDALDMAVFPAGIRNLFKRAFQYDATTAVKQSTIAKRPSAKEWRVELNNFYSSGVITCSVNTLHEYPQNYSKGCPWCAIEKRRNTNNQTSSSTPSTQKIQQNTATQNSQPQNLNSSNKNPTKKKWWKKFFGISIILFVLYWIVMYHQIMSAYNANNWGQAMQYIDATPLFSQVFSDVYHEVERNLNVPSAVIVGSNSIRTQAGQITRVEFRAPTSGTYVFTTSGNDDTYGYLYSNATTMSAIQSDDDSGTNSNFKIEYQMTANQRVYIGVKFYNSEVSGNIALNISKKTTTITPSPSPTPTINTVGTGQHRISVNTGQVARVKFVAPSAGTYVFTTTGNDDTFGYLFSTATTTSETRSDDDSGDNQNFQIEYYMNANQSIYVGVKYFAADRSGVITLSITKKANPTPTPTPAINTVSTGSHRISVNAGRIARVKFTAPSSGTYIFTSTGSDDTVGYLYSTATTTSETRSDDDSGTNNNFKIEYSMNANQSIYVGVKFYSSDKTGSITLSITKKTEASKPWPIGETCRVTVGSGNARSGPGTDYSYAGSIYANDQFTILDCTLGNTGKDWYKIRLDGKTCWISSGLVEVNGYREGTKNGVPIQ